MNPVKGEVPLELADGRKFRLVLDMEALVEAETAYGKPLQQMMSDAGQGFMGASGALLQGALSRHHTISRGEALDILRTDGEAVADALARASEAAFPQGEEAEGNAPAPSSGKTSGGNGAKQGSNRKTSGKQPRAASA